MKVAELTGVLLDYWTACADVRTAKILKPGDMINSMRVKEEMCAVLTPGYDDWWQPFHVYWGSCGKIIEREKIGINTWTGDWCAQFTFPVTHPTNPKRDPSHHCMRGETPLIAAMRTYVASRFGDTVPDEAGTR